MADEADLDAIRQFVASGGQIGVDKEGNPVVPESALTPSLDQPTPAAPAAPTPGQTAAEQRAAQREADRQADRQARAQEKAQTQAQRRAKEAHERNPLVRFSNAVGEWAANVPTPGGNLALVLLLLFFAFAIIPVNSGQTRLQLIWDVLTGNADLPGAGQASGPDVAAQAGAVASTIGTGAQGVASAVGGVFSTIGTGAHAVVSGGGPGGPNAAGFIPPQQQSGAGLLEPPRS